MSLVLTEYRRRGIYEFFTHSLAQGVPLSPWSPSQVRDPS